MSGHKPDKRQEAKIDSGITSEIEFDWNMIMKIYRCEGPGTIMSEEERGRHGRNTRENGPSCGCGLFRLLDVIQLVVEGILMLQLRLAQCGVRITLNSVITREHGSRNRTLIAVTSAQTFANGSSISCSFRCLAINFLTTASSSF